jgi:hypothetical protein
MHKMIQLILICFQENHVSFYVITCSLGQFDEKINHMKIKKVLKF